MYSVVNKPTYLPVNPPIIPIYINGLKLAKNCLKNERVKDIFPKAEFQHKMRKRKQKTFKVKQIKTERYKKSAVPYMTELLNNDAAKRRKIMKETD